MGHAGDYQPRHPPSDRLDARRFPSISWAPTSDRIALDIGTKIAIVGVSPDLEASEPTIISATDYEDFIDPLWPG